MAAEFDFSDLTKLAANLGEVSGNAGPLVRKAVTVTSVNVKKAAADSVKAGGRAWKALPRTINFDLTVEAGVGGSSITSEVGYDKSKGAGNLGNIREFGSSRAVPHNDLRTALEANQADFEHGLGLALEQAEKAAGL